MRAFPWREGALLLAALILVRDSVQFLPTPVLMTGLHVNPYAQTISAPADKLWTAPLTHATWRHSTFPPTKAASRVFTRQHIVTLSALRYVDYRQPVVSGVPVTGVGITILLFFAALAARRWLIHTRKKNNAVVRMVPTYSTVTLYGTDAYSTRRNLQ